MRDKSKKDGRKFRRLGNFIGVAKFRNPCEISLCSLFFAFAVLPSGSAALSFN